MVFSGGGPHEGNEGVRGQSQFAGPGGQVEDESVQGLELLCRIRGYGTSPASQLHQAFVTKVLVRAQHSVHIDAQCFGDFPCGRKSVAGPKSADRGLVPDRIGQLCEQRFVAVRLHSE